MSELMQDAFPSTPDDAPILIRSSRDGDVEAMLAIYRRHIRRGIDDHVEDSGMPEPEG